jgi:hypothetical protein
MKGIRNLYRTMMLLWLVFRMCYMMASTASNSAALAHTRINDVITQVGALHSGSLSAGQAVNATNAVNASNLDLGNGNLTSMFTGSVDPAYASPMGPVSGTVTAGEVNTIINFCNTLVTWAQYMQAQLNAHNFSSN